MRSSGDDHPIDYLLIGHLSCDRTAEGLRLGGSVAYAALTARALGMRPGVVTAWGGEIDLLPLADIPMSIVPAERSTTFENRDTPQGRVQILHARARPLTWEHIPPEWRSAPLVHLAPIADEVAPDLTHRFPQAMVCATPQGWLRVWDANGRVQPRPWLQAAEVMPHLKAAVLSREDLKGQGQPEWLRLAQVTALTAGPGPVTLLLGAETRQVNPPAAKAVDTTGAGDIFAAAFFVALYRGLPVRQAAQLACELASASVSGVGLEGVPKPNEITRLSSWQMFMQSQTRKAA